MTYSPKLSSAFNDTYLRSNHISSQSGMCSFCTEECDGTCEIAIAAVLGKQTVYPINTGNNQVASEKKYPIDFSHFNINGRVFGATGVNPNYEEANIYKVNLEREYGKFNPVRMTMPIILPALIKLNWEDYFGGAAMAGVTCVIGEEARDKDPDLKIENGKIVEFAALKSMLDSFRKYYRGYGQIVLQCNVEDDMLGLPEYAVREHNVEAIEFKFGQSAKGTQPVRKIKNRDEALEKQKMGILVFPDPMDPEIIKKAEEGTCPNFYSYARLPLWDEEYLIGRIEKLREMGVKNFYLKMAGYDRKDLERVIMIGSKAQVDMITFDGAGGGTGYSPCKMMNEWGLPTILLEDAVCTIVEKLKTEGYYIPA
ncbi:MAG: FMN-binding glutamate synthase family protein, partial [Tissierellia bacterium]|nr:FMN-binding glutamate synthase family protein [Tissierellia bacterium]